MALPNKDFHRSSSPHVQQTAPRRISWVQRLRQRVSTPVVWGQFWQNIQSRNTARSSFTTEHTLVRYQPPRDQGSSTNLSIATHIAQSQRLSTPTADHRPHTAPPNFHSITFQPIRWELRDHDAPSSNSSSTDNFKSRCPYDPAVLQFFDNFEGSASFCGLGSRWPWSTKRQLPTPCNECLKGTDRAHINVSPSRFSRGHSRRRTRRSSASTIKEGSGPSQPVKEVSSELHINQPRTLCTPKSHWQKSPHSSNTCNLSARPPERMGYREESNSAATFRSLKEAVLSASTHPNSRFPPPRLHQLSPDIAFVHRHEVAAHQAAIREGRHSPVLDHQARGGSPVEVVGYMFHPGRRDSSSTVLYSETNIPGEYIPPPPRETPSPPRVLSPFQRKAISLEPVTRPMLISRLDQPPFVPALPEGTVLRPMREWGRSTSAPESWESVLEHSAVYRAREADYTPRVPSPLHACHGAESLRESSWSHGTMPLDEGEVREADGWRSRMNGVSNEPNMRGGGAKDDDLRDDGMRGAMLLNQQWRKYCDADCHGDYFTRSPLPQGYSLSACMRTTTEMPHLRGGGEPDRRKRIPSSLFYLAGATGRKPGESITVHAWSSMKPKKRMGGLLGMVVFGYKSGKPYIPNTRDQDVQTGPELETGSTALETMDAGAGGESPASSSARALSPMPSSAPELDQSGKKETISKNTPAYGSDGICDLLLDAEARDALKSVPERGADNAPAAAGTTPEPASKSSVAEETTPSDAKASPTTDQNPNPAAGRTQNTTNPAPGKAFLPSPTRPPNVDASGEKEDVTTEGSHVSIRLTPEEVVNKVVEEMKKKGLVG